jgi:site-specific DNA-methyltransferase (adenine-specific)
MELLPEKAVTRNSIHHMDLFTLCNAMSDASVDMILCDLPYGTTACKWDSVIPMTPMWEQFKRIIKPRGAIVLTASQPFTSALVSSNYEMFRYEWIWEKEQGVNFQLVKQQPQKVSESILIFSKGACVYYPQGLQDCYIVKSNKKKQGNLRHISVNQEHYIQTVSGYPKNIIKIPRQTGLHPTQKPVALWEYLIKTYTLEGDLVFDPCVGSGTTAVAARNLGRDYICGDFTRGYVELARDRVQNSDPFKSSVDRKTGKTQLSLFEDT